MFFKDFMAEVAAIEAAGRFKNPAETEEVTKEDEVIGQITDPYLKALCTASRNQMRSFKDKFRRMTTGEAEIACREIEAVKNIMWAELRLHFGVFDGSVGLRKGWTLVKEKEEEQQTPRSRIPPGLEILLGALCSALGGCGDPNCPECGGGGGKDKKSSIN